MEETCKGRGVGKGMRSFPYPLAMMLLCIATGSSTKELYEPWSLGCYGGFTTQAWLIKSLASGDQSQSSAPLISSEIRRSEEYD